jgi:hypothetical protein
MDGSPDWHILVQGEVSSALIVVARITPQQMAQMLLAEHDDMVKAVPSDRADRPFAISVLPNLCSQQCARPEHSEQCAPEQATDISHRPAASPNSTSFASGPGFRQQLRRPASSLRTLRRVSYCGDRIGGPVSAWAVVLFCNCIARTHWRPEPIHGAQVAPAADVLFD